MTALKNRTRTTRIGLISADKNLRKSVLVNEMVKFWTLINADERRFSLWISVYPRESAF